MADHKPNLFLLQARNDSGNNLLAKKEPELIINGLYTAALEKNDVNVSISKTGLGGRIGKKKSLLPGKSKTDDTKDLYCLRINT